MAGHILDEMYIKGELVYNKQTGELVGFTNLGTISQHLSEFEQSTQSVSESDPTTTTTQSPQTALGSYAQPSLAKTMLVMMMRGLLTNSQFPCHNSTGDQMYDLFWEAVMHIENIGLGIIVKQYAIYTTSYIAKIILQVLAVTCDDASVNHRFMRLHDPVKLSDMTYKVLNIYATDKKRYIYFISNPPHLIKTVRNCWASKHRNLLVC